MSAASVPERGERPTLPPALAKGLLAVMLFVAVPATLSGIGGGYLYQIATTALIFVILAASLNLVTGTAGLLSLGHAGFYGIGAYVAALLSTRLGVSFLVTLPAAGAVAGAIGTLVALPTMRLVSIYFAVATLGIGEMIYVTLLNWTDFTRGPMGIRGIPDIEILGWEPHSPMQQYLVVASVAAVSLWVLSRLTHSYFGNALRAVREDDQCASAMGLNVVHLKIVAFGASCCFAGIAGALLAHTANFISPDQFQFSEFDQHPGDGGRRRAGKLAWRGNRGAAAGDPAGSAAQRRRLPHDRHRLDHVFQHPAAPEGTAGRSVRAVAAAAPVRRGVE